ncbi:hypothetical protein [Ectopseudomonas oleovorans]|uniref:Uncharacterized protein n=1 Tax=Ectopseudomonas oleovorans TaxID=301 RepID=A0AA42QB72_ECTOL|nr:hypothetical protein [Pseudomonas oleovorans]MDH1340535.1 hypothetical protein [Pseudomonas oleovorans]MDH1491507.1 hypothetical protein [Pseudomonas oleovorans]WGG22382.1 hypothetical protein N5O83_06855 [Pseudomonas oleovorans]
MDRTEYDPQESSGLSRFAIPADAPVRPLSAHLVADFDRAVAAEHFDHEEPADEE